MSHLPPIVIHWMTELAKLPRPLSSIVNAPRNYTRPSYLDSEEALNEELDIRSRVKDIRQG